MQSRRASRKTRATPELFEVGKPETEIRLVANFRVARHPSTITRCPRGLRLFGFFAGHSTTMPVAWVHATSEPLLIGNPLQKSGELPLFTLRDSGEQRLRMLAGNAAYPVKC